MKTVRKGVFEIFYYYCGFVISVGFEGFNAHMHSAQFADDCFSIVVGFFKKFKIEFLPSDYRH